MTSAQTVRHVNRLLKPLDASRFPLLKHDDYAVYCVCHFCDARVKISHLAYRKGCWCYRLPGVRGWWHFSDDSYLIDSFGYVFLEVKGE